MCSNQSNQSSDLTDQTTIRGKIVVVDTTNRKIADVNANSGLNAIRANVPKEVGTVVCLDYRTRKVGSYTNGGDAIQSYAYVTLLDKTTSMIIGQTTIDGPPSPETISGGSGYGGDVSEADIVTYILSLPKNSSIPTPIATPKSLTVPVVTSVIPNNGGGEDIVTITGSKFTGATHVFFGKVAAFFTVDNDTQITATSPLGLSGTVDVTVETPDGTSATSSADQFAYI